MKLVPRAGWGARPPKSTTALPAGKVDTIYAHYSASDADEQVDHVNCPGRVRGIQNYHMDHQGWNDIAYSFLVCKHGYVFEGRGLGVKPAATGADNSHSLAVCWLGDDTKNRDDLFQSGQLAFVDAFRHIEHWAGKQLQFKGHRDAMSTSCPGDELYQFIHSAGFLSAVRANVQDLTRRQGFFAWAAWRLGEGDWKAYGPLNPSVRPNVPRNIVVERPTWFPRLAAMLAARKGP